MRSGEREMRIARDGDRNREGRRESRRVIEGDKGREKWSQEGERRIRC